MQCFAASFLLYSEPRCLGSADEAGIPLIGRLLSLLYLSLTNSLYCFESLWQGRGWSLCVGSIALRLMV